MSPLSDDQAWQLLEQARQAASRAFAPYSRFPVGAALLLHPTVVVTGCNVESASYGLTVCAERVAIVQAVSQGLLSAGNQRQAPVQAVAVWAQQPVNHHVTPCGACRQVLSEWLPPDAVVVMAHPTQPGAVVQQRMDQLLPLAFAL